MKKIISYMLSVLTAICFMGGVTILATAKGG